MSAYIIFNYKILDRIKIEEVRGLLEPILKKYETEVIVASPVKTIEGEKEIGVRDQLFLI